MLFYIILHEVGIKDTFKISTNQNFNLWSIEYASRAIVLKPLSTNQPWSDIQIHLDVDYQNIHLHNYL